MKNKWNWGAFFLCPFWSLSHHIWVGIIPLIPIILIAMASCLSVVSPSPAGILFLLLGVNQISIFIAILYGLISILVGYKGNAWVIKTVVYQNMDNNDFILSQKIWSALGVLLSVPVNFMLFYSTYQMMNLSIKMLELYG
jgi:hypothetical protein